MQFYSERLRYEKFTPDHFEDYFRLVSQKDVMLYISGAGLDMEGARKRFERSLHADDQQSDMGFVAVYEQVTGLYIGLGKIVPFEDGLTEIGYALLPEFWGKGYASEITSRLVAYARECGSVESLVALVIPENHASVNVLTKHQFRFFREVPDGDVMRHDYILDL
ncbi:GNAT family N-acetyltransferase [Dyadobacter jiangsuensis]|uniref:GNAT family N-acetyltransferase n=1 Tax=Dyadobacter fermentans TaxID=94254 RepID=UPI001CBE4A40|nr:GNAT family N-acetyltransferase [Dyadobacter fermentans]MBZ1361179.1 GNAT family N-acetyltransferase [Dyadobacter fermentans]